MDRRHHQRQQLKEQWQQAILNVENDKENLEKNDVKFSYE
jgi:hypothetical protein